MHRSIPQSIDTRPIVPEWKDTSADADNYDADRNDSPTGARAATTPL